MTLHTQNAHNFTLEGLSDFILLPDGGKQADHIESTLLTRGVVQGKLVESNLSSWGISDPISGTRYKLPDGFWGVAVQSRNENGINWFVELCHQNGRTVTFAIRSPETIREISSLAQRLTNQLCLR